MIGFNYLHRGLSAMAHAHRANSMAGHLGAAVVAGYFFGEDQPDLSAAVIDGVERELDRIVAGDESLWFNPDVAGVTIPQLFELVPITDVREDRIIELPSALSENIGQLRQSGHNVIFASIAIRALQNHPQFAAAEMIDGLVQLIRSFDDAGPGRGYYGEAQGWIEGDPSSLPPDPLPPYRDLPAMADAVIDELIASASLRRRGYGSLFHIINHAAALIELSRLGFDDLAQRGLPAHHVHLRLWQALPDVSAELGSLEAADYDPLTPEYWQPPVDSTQWSAHLTHRIKTLYGFYNLLRSVDEPSRRDKAEAQFRYLMA